MTLKQSYKEFSAMLNLLALVNEITPKGIQETVLHGVLFSLYKKYYNKALKVKKKYSITAEPAELCAFFLFFSKFQMTGQDTFTINMVIQLNNKIHQKFAV